jgi:hypothetical protein
MSVTAFSVVGSKFEHFYKNVWYQEKRMARATVTYFFCHLKPIMTSVSAGSSEFGKKVMEKWSNIGKRSRV